MNTQMQIGDEYNWKNQPERLKYIGKKGVWHQFELTGKQGVWCEVLDEDLHMLEKTALVEQHSAPCKQCPWRKDSAPGWLGSSSPLEFLQQSEAELRMPCHLHVDYESEDWQTKQASAPQCVGRAVHFKNRFKTPRNTELIKADAVYDSVFTNPQDFIDHHSRGLGPQIMIIGSRVHTQFEGPNQ